MNVELSSKKGMSQILTLIVAASVLMMTALIIVFMAQGSLNDLFSSTNTQGCKAVVESQCGINPGGSISVPTQCDSTTAGTLSDYENVQNANSNTISCSPAGGGS